MDVHDAGTRSRNMAAIRSTDTKPELQIRRAMHAAGLRFRLHVKELPGRPDLFFPRFRAVVFVNGCFWHRHDCHLFHWPATRLEFWKQKLNRNVEKDAAAISQLQAAGWRVGIVWECALKGRTKLDAGETMRRLAEWIRSDETMISIRGT